MRRLSSNSIPPSWRKVAALALVFVMGIASDRLIMLISPMIYRVVNVTDIQGRKAKGVEGLQEATTSCLAARMGSGTESGRWFATSTSTSRTLRHYSASVIESMVQSAVRHHSVPTAFMGA